LGEVQSTNRYLENEVQGLKQKYSELYTNFEQASIRLKDYERKFVEQSLEQQKTKQELPLEVESLQLLEQRKLFENSSKETKDKLAQIEDENKKFLGQLHAYEEQSKKNAKIIEDLMNQNTELMGNLEYTRRLHIESKQPGSVQTLMAEKSKLIQQLHSQNLLLEQALNEKDKLKERIVQLESLSTSKILDEQEKQIQQLHSTISGLKKSLNTNADGRTSEDSEKLIKDLPNTNVPLNLLQNAAQVRHAQEKNDSDNKLKEKEDGGMIDLEPDDDTLTVPHQSSQGIDNPEPGWFSKGGVVGTIWSQLTSS